MSTRMDDAERVARLADLRTCDNVIPATRFVDAKSRTRQMQARFGEHGQYAYTTALSLSCKVSTMINAFAIRI